MQLSRPVCPATRCRRRTPDPIKPLLQRPRTGLRSHRHGIARARWAVRSRARQCDKQGPNAHENPRFGVSLNARAGRWIGGHHTEPYEQNTQQSPGFLPWRRKPHTPTKTRTHRNGPVCETSAPGAHVRVLARHRAAMDPAATRSLRAGRDAALPAVRL